MSKFSESELGDRLVGVVIAVTVVTFFAQFFIDLTAIEVDHSLPFEDARMYMEGPVHESSGTTIYGPVNR